jgi:hypothetical protein
VSSFDEPIEIGFGEIGENWYFAKSGEEGRFVGWVAWELQRTVQIRGLVWHICHSHVTFNSVPRLLVRGKRVIEPWPDIDE